MNAHQIPALMEIVLTHLDPIIVNVMLDSRGLLPSRHASVRQFAFTYENIPLSTATQAVEVKSKFIKIRHGMKCAVMLLQVYFILPQYKRAPFIHKYYLHI